MDAMTILGILLILFVAGHLLPSRTNVRPTGAADADDDDPVRKDMEFFSLTDDERPDSYVEDMRRDD